MPTAVAYALSRQILFDQNAKPVVGGFLSVNQAGTTQLATSYADAGLTTPNPNPVRTDGFGRVPPIYFGAGTFKVVVQDASGAGLFVDDNLPGGSGATQGDTGGGGDQSAGGDWETGDLKPSWRNDAQAGWVFANGSTIGNAGSGGSARASDDALALFVVLWNNDPSLVVSNGRGVSATADFNAGKTIALPDMRGRGFVGCDRMGAASLAGVLTTASTATPDKVGAMFGVDTVAISVSQLPIFTPSVTIGTDGDHTHTAGSGPSGGHSHTGTTGLSGLHSHSYSKVVITSSTSGTSFGSANSQTDNTSSDGNHTHSLMTDAVGDHTHNIAVYGNGSAHTHSVTSSPIGSGQGHFNMPPSALIFWHIRL